MRFRPCIDIHNGKVKQIVGSSLVDRGDQAKENFVSERPASWYASKYAQDELRGGHVILLNAASSDYYESTRRQAMEALGTAPGYLQVGGGIRPENAEAFLDAGASHVIVTSYVFYDGHIDRERLERMKKAVGKEHLVLDLSCRRRGDDYYVVTDRWQNMTSEKLDTALLDELAGHCDEFLIHAVDVEGKANGPEQELLQKIGGWDGIPVTYAGGIRNLEDLGVIREAAAGRIDATIGSALDLFGGPLSYEEVVRFCR